MYTKFLRIFFRFTIWSNISKWIEYHRGNRGQVYNTCSQFQRPKEDATRASFLFFSSLSLCVRTPYYNAIDHIRNSRIRSLNIMVFSSFLFNLSLSPLFPHWLVDCGFFFSYTVSVDNCVVHIQFGIESVFFSVFRCFSFPFNLFHSGLFFVVVAIHASISKTHGFCLCK